MLLEVHLWLAINETSSISLQLAEKESARVLHNTGPLSVEYFVVISLLLLLTFAPRISHKPLSFDSIHVLVASLHPFQLTLSSLTFSV